MYYSRVLMERWMRKWVLEVAILLYMCNII